MPRAKQFGEAPLSLSLSRSLPPSLPLSPFLSLHPSPGHGTAHITERVYEVVLQKSRTNLPTYPWYKSQTSSDVTRGIHRLNSQKVFIKSFCKSQLPHKSVTLSFILVIIKDKLSPSYYYISPSLLVQGLRLWIQGWGFSSFEISFDVSSFQLPGLRTRF